MSSFLPSFILLSLFISSCTLNDDTGGKVCTEEFVTHTITVLEPNEQPADSVDINVRNKESGDTYDVCQDNICDSVGSRGRYVIFHDGFQGDISKESEDIIVSGSKDTLSFSADFSFYDDGCHVRKLAGPDTVRLQ